jgi:hypothetical protein
MKYLLIIYCQQNHYDITQSTNNRNVLWNIWYGQEIGIPKSCKIFIIFNTHQLTCGSSLAHLMLCESEKDREIRRKSVEVQNEG